MTDLSFRERDPETGRFRPIDEFIRGSAQYGGDFNLTSDRHERIRRAEINVIELAEALCDKGRPAPQVVFALDDAVAALRAARRS